MYGGVEGKGVSPGCWERGRGPEGVQQLCMMMGGLRGVQCGTRRAGRGRGFSGRCPINLKSPPSLIHPWDTSHSWYFNKLWPLSK